jgi:ribonucleoside-diphosphate reductase alpha chain
MPGLLEEERKRVNRPVPDLPISEDTDIVDVKPARPAKPASGQVSLTSSFVNQLDAPTCPNCGHVAVRNGACFKCLNCGESLGCS